MARKVKITSRQGFDLMNMCTPATIYFVISLVGLILIGLNNKNKFQSSYDIENFIGDRLRIENDTFFNQSFQMGNDLNFIQPSNRFN